MALLSSPTPSEIIEAVNTVTGKIESLSAADIRIRAIDGLNASNVQEALAASFQSVTSGKSSVEGAIIEKGGTVSKAGTVATFDELVQGVSGISTNGSPSGGGEIEVKFENQIFYGALRSLGNILKYSKAMSGYGEAVIGDELIIGGGDYYTYQSAALYAYTDKVLAVNPVSSTCRDVCSLSEAKSRSSSMSIDNEAIFGGGNAGKNLFSALSTIDAVNPFTNTRRSLPSLSKSSWLSAATAAGRRAIFGGGWDGSAALSFVDAIDLVTSTTSVLPDLSTPRCNMGCGSIGDNIVFGGGHIASGDTVNYNIIDVINHVSETTKSFTFPVGHQSPKSVVFDDEVVFSGNAKTVEAVNPITQTIRSLPDMSVSSSGIKPKRVGQEILFAGGDGGQSSSSYSSVVEAVNPISNTKRAVASLAVARTNLASGVVNGEVVCAGGKVNAYDASNLVEVVNPSPGYMAFKKLILNGTISLSTDVSINVPCTYRDVLYSANERFAFDPTVTSAKLGDVTADSVTVKGTYYIRQGEYSL